MVAKILTIAAVVLLALALVGGSAYILLRPTDGEALLGGCQSHTDSTDSLQNRNGQGGNGHAVSGEGVEYPSEGWRAISGTVVSLDGSELIVESDEGQFVVELGPEWYWETNGMPLSAGDALELSGFDEKEGFRVAQVVNLTTGQTALLRDAMGHPLWSGRGRRGG